MAHEEAEPEFAQLGVEQVREPEDFTEVVAADLDRRFADLVGGFGRRMRVAFGNQDADLGFSLAELECETQAGEPSTCNHDVVSVAHHHVPNRVLR